MRTAQRSEMQPRSDTPHGLSSNLHVKRLFGVQSTALLLATVAVFTYIVGILYEKLVAPGLFAGSTHYYLESTSYSSYLSVFLRMQTASFFHLTVVLLLGFHLLGNVFSVLFCSFNGLLLGLCMAGVANHGSKLLGCFCLINGGFIICHSINVLWLCAAAKTCGQYLFCKTLNRNIPQSANHSTYRLKYMITSYILSLLFSLLYSSIGALVAILFAGVLL